MHHTVEPLDLLAVGCTQVGNDLTEHMRRLSPRLRTSSRTIPPWTGSDAAAASTAATSPFPSPASLRSPPLDRHVHPSILEGAFPIACPGAEGG